MCTLMQYPINLFFFFFTSSLKLHKKKAFPYKCIDFNAKKYLPEIQYFINDSVLRNMIYVIAKLSTFNLEILMTFLLIIFEIKQKI